MQTSRAMLSALAVLGLLLAPAARGAGEAAGKNLDLEKLTASAEAGDRKAQAALGSAYLYGWSTEKDDVQAAKWLRMAAEQGHPLAQFSVGELFRAGRGGLEKNEREAVAWWQKAAEQGNAFAQGNLAHAYFTGFGGLEKDLVKARMWNTLAAGQKKHTKDVDIRQAEFDTLLTPEEREQADRLAQEWLQSREPRVFSEAAP